MIVTVLCPTRNRIEALKRSYDSLKEHTQHEFEFLIAVDDDDTNDYSEFNVALRTPRHGYKNLHRYYNELAKKAKGTWLFLWNDDCLMQSSDWVASLAAVKPRVILNPATNHGGTLCTFPIVPKAFVDAVGHFSLNCSNDTWWEEIGKVMGILEQKPDISVLHDRADLTGNNKDEVYEQREYDSAAFYGQAMKRERERDMRIIGGLLGR